VGNITETAEDLNFVLSKFRAIIAWASASPAKRIFFVSLVGSVVLIGQYVYLNSLLQSNRSSSDSHVQELTLLSKEHRYKTALDSIVLCIEATKEKSAHSDWYCKDAVTRYQRASENWPQERVKEVSAKHAYGAMRIDVSYYIRSIELDRLLIRPPTKDKELLDLLLSKTAIALCSFLVVSLITGTAFLLWRTSARGGLPGRGRIAPHLET